MAVSFQQNNYKRYMLDIVALYRNRPDIKAYLEILLSIITISIFVIFAIKPTLVTIANLITNISSLQKTSDDLTTKINNLSIAQNISNKEQGNINLLASAIPTGPDVASYVRQFEGTIQKDGVSPLSFSVDALDLLAKGSGTAGFNISVSGDYSHLDTFLHDVENLRRPPYLNKMIFSGSSGGKGALNLNFSAKSPFD